MSKTYSNAPKHALDVTPKELFMNRRRFIGASLGALSVPALAGNGFSAVSFKAMPNNKFQASESLKITDSKLAKNYTNFYEFGLDKEKPASAFSKFNISPWVVEIGGLIEKPLKIEVEELASMFAIEERVYRLRCVEAWSAVIPWAGFPLQALLEKIKPKRNAKFVSFESFFAPFEAPGQARLSYPWPYREGLRLDEAMNNLTFMGLGMYGEPLDKPNGAPIRLVVPWKYGFKSIKSIRKIELVETMPLTMWSQLIPPEYGFYANVNPEVDHPRWSQKTEKPLGSWLGRVPTQKFNGYAKDVEHLYKGMDLAKDY